MPNNPTQGQVLVFPARTPEIAGERIFYLFSVRQVAEVLIRVNVQPVPYAPPYAEGVIQWRGRVLPVLSLEHFLGIGVSADQMHLRSIVVRSVAKDRGDTFHEEFTVFKVGAATRQMDLPLTYEPVNVPDWIDDGTVLSGAYRLERHLFLVINMKAILRR